MLSLGRCTGRTCQTITRRSFLRVGTLGPLGLTLADYFAARAAGQSPAGPARSVILLWLWGGPSHVDTFDMKPDAPAEYRGPFAPIATKVPGLEICELLPALARCADKFALVRTMHHDEVDHGVAGTIGLTGSSAGGVALDAQRGGAVRPSTGSIVGRLQPRRPGSLPPYVILGNPLQQGRKRVIGEGGGTLGSAYDPFRLRYEPGSGLKLPDVELPESLGAERLSARWDLLRRLDGGVGPGGDSTPSARLGHHYALAQDLITARQSLAALDVEFRKFNYVGDTHWMRGKVTRHYLADGDRPALLARVAAMARG